MLVLFYVNVAVCSVDRVKVSTGRPLVEKVDIRNHGFTSAFGGSEKNTRVAHNVKYSVSIDFEINSN